MICIPAHNEAGNIGGLIRACKALYPDHQLLVVDDGSTDDTANIAFRNGAIVVSNPKGSQYGDGFIRGCLYALQTNASIVFMDAGFSYQPTELHSFIQTIPKVRMITSYRFGHQRLLTRLGRWALRQVCPGKRVDYSSMRAFNQSVLCDVIAMALPLDRRAHIFNPELAYKLAHHTGWLETTLLVAYHPTNTTLRPWGAIGAALAFGVFLLKERLECFGKSIP